MTDLATTVENVLETAETLKAAGAANEANTKAHMIEPVLSALGWNLSNFSEVDREYKVFDGTFLDYALRIDGKPKLFVEAKALGKTLADKKFISQTINYANNEGVVWCVLTNGLIYQVYKSNESVDMESKLLFEVNLRDASDEAGPAGVISSLQTLAKEAVQSGTLDIWGETVFTDLRVRQALTHLGNNPPPSLIKAVSSAIDDASVDGPRLRASLKRLLGQLSASSPGVAIVGGVPGKVTAKVGQTGKVETPVSPDKKTFGVEHHTAKKPTAIVDLFQRIDSFARAQRARRCATTSSASSTTTWSSSASRTRGGTRSTTAGRRRTSTHGCTGATSRARRTDRCLTSSSSFTPAASTAGTRQATRAGTATFRLSRAPSFSGASLAVSRATRRTPPIAAEQQRSGSSPSPQTLFRFALLA